MKNFIIFFFIVAAPSLSAQSGFSPEDYKAFLEVNKNLTTEELLELHSPQTVYYSSRENVPVLNNLPWFDSINETLQLTGDEKALLMNNYFVVTERQFSHSWMNAFVRLYNADLPLFLSTDFILFSLHQSYDNILKSIEVKMLEPNLFELIRSMRNEFEEVYTKYKDREGYKNSLEDVDLYLTVAASLIGGNQVPAYAVDEAEIKTVLDAIQSEKMTSMPLFTRSDLYRRLDFSQFTPRGHYTDIVYTSGGQKTLENYFRTMMWLGRIDFLLTSPPENPWEIGWLKSDLQRMNLSALILNEVLYGCDKYELYQAHEEIITFMVGPDDNLTPGELHALHNTYLGSLDEVLNETQFDAFTDALNSSDDYGQKIMSNFFLVDPNSEDPGKLPISFKLLGQKFLIDSYVFSEVVFDRIFFDGEKQFRMLPDPLDILAVFGNEDALALLEPEMEVYHYAYKISELQYLVNAYDDEFWTQSLYNTWLSSLLELNPPASSDNLPYFMQTTAWHHEKMNTQLTSWAQLRHDNILYGKQSYTGGTGCSFPYTYVEPYPAFYAHIAAFADKASEFFAETITDTDLKEMILDYYRGYGGIMDKLETIAQKELDRTPLNESEIIFLKTMINSYMASGPSVSGWINDLLFPAMDTWDFDFTVADVHTQPTEPGGAVVGNVLHVGNGLINLGVFIAPGTVEPGRTMCYAGPVGSFHTQVEKDFKRLNDEAWEALFLEGKVPERPDWVYHYLADRNGERKTAENVLKGIQYTGSDIEEEVRDISYLVAFPNPATDEIHFRFVLNANANVTGEIYDLAGRQVDRIQIGRLQQGEHNVTYHLDEINSGVYYFKLHVNDGFRIGRFVVR
jgi:hypothetical protein